MDGQAILTGSLPADLGNETQMLLERFVARGMAHDEAACVVASAAADFARMQYGDRYLNGLCAVVASRGGKKLSVI